MVEPPIIKIKLHHTKFTNCNCPVLDKTRVLKYLGIMIDEFLRCSEHIIDVGKRLRALITEFYNLRDILSNENL